MHGPIEGFLVKVYNSACKSQGTKQNTGFGAMVTVPLLQKLGSCNIRYVAAQVCTLFVCDAVVQRHSVCCMNQAFAAVER